MEIEAGFQGREDAIVDLFTETFATSEGPEEGALIGNLVQDLLGQTPAADIRVFRAVDGDLLIAAVVFTRLTYPEDTRYVVLLSPMAVGTGFQRQGVGQAVIRHALATLRSEGAELAITYGDPEYYRRVGFHPINEVQIQPPLPLSVPRGWIGQSLTGGEMPILAGKPKCVPAMNRADVW